MVPLLVLYPVLMLVLFSVVVVVVVLVVAATDLSKQTTVRSTDRVLALCLPCRVFLP